MHIPHRQYVGFTDQILTAWLIIDEEHRGVTPIIVVLFEIELRKREDGADLGLA